LGVRVTGTVGLLLLAKEHRLIPSVTDYLEALRLYGYWLSDEIIAAAIYEAGEEKV
jgi:predicted nucleic acid-binding protein